MPDSIDAWVTKGDLLRIHGHFADAVVAYSEPLKRLPELGDDAWAILFARASCLDRLGKWPEAEKDLQQALVLKPDQPDVLNYLGFTRLEHGESLQEAGVMIAKAVKARPNDAQIVDSMGWVLYLQGAYQEATQYLEKAVELLPGDPEVNDHLGDVYWRLGRKTEARFQWERSLSFSPQDKLSNSIHKKLKEGLPPPNTMADSIPVNAPEKPLMAATP
jgi:Flp pilus assembly protein TadD